MEVEDDNYIISKAEFVNLNNQIKSLKDKVQYYDRQIELLVLENEKLRLENIIEEVHIPRKIAKSDAVKFCSKPSSSSVSVKSNILSATAESCASNVINNTKVSSNSMVTSGSKQKKFQVIDANVFNVRKQILAGGCSQFMVTQASATAPVKVNVSPVEACKVRDALKKVNASFHEFKLPEERFSGFIITGLVGIDEEALEDIKLQLIEKGLPNSIVVSAFYTASMRAKKAGPLVKLVLPPQTDSKILLTITSLSHVGVRFESLKSNKVLQCKNCQRFGHSASGCQHQHRCVKCGQNHLKNECQRTTDKGSTLQIILMNANIL